MWEPFYLENKIEKNQFPFGTSRVTLDTLALVQRFHYRFLSFYLFSKGSRSSWTVDFFSSPLVVMRVICTSRQRSIVKKPQAIFKVLNPIHKRWCIIISSACNFLKKDLRKPQNQNSRVASKNSQNSRTLLPKVAKKARYFL